MTGNRHLPSEQVQKAAASLRALLPEYDPLITFYEQLFTAQENSRLQITLEPIIIAAEVLDGKHRERQPLVGMTEFVFDVPAGRKMLVHICEVIRTSGNQMAPAADRIISALGKDFEIEPLFRNLLAGGDEYYDDTAGRIGCDKNTLAFIAYNSLKPSLTICAEQLSTYLKDRTEWRSGACPVCGGLPAIGVLDLDGRRNLFCSFCWHDWPMPRVFCPFCSNTDGSKLNYLYSETEKAYRLDCCENCRKYIKVVDERAANRPVYPPLEQVASLHLDIMARKAGFDTGILLHLPND